MNAPDCRLYIQLGVWEGLIDTDALAVPGEDELPDIDVPLAGVILHAEQRNVARLRAATERQIGRRLHRLRERDAFKRLWTTQLGDYAAERLELGRRNAQEITRLGGALEELPLLREACDAGTQGQSHLRLLTRVATPDTEQAWLERARGLCTRALAKLVKASRKGEAPPEKGFAPEEEPEKDATSAEPDEDETVEVRFGAPSWLAARWQSGVDLFRKVDGRDNAPEGAAAEAFMAEWLAGAPRPRGEIREGSGHDPELAAWLALTRRQARAHEQQIAENEDNWQDLDSIGRAMQEVPVWLDRFKGELSDDPRVLDRELLELARARRTLEAVSGRILLTQSRIRAYGCMRFQGLGHYAREKLGLAESTARGLRRIERGLFEVPAVQRAYLRGEIGNAKVRQLLRVCHTGNEEAWLERARRVTVRRLEDEVRAVWLRIELEQAGVAAGEGGDWFEPLEEGIDLERYACALKERARQTGEGVKVRESSSVIRFQAEPDLASAWLEALAACRAAEGRWLEEWECADRFLDAFFESWGREDLARGHRIPARDGWRCTTPGCLSRRELQVHHIVWQSQGGSDEDWNLTTVCSQCHLHLIHERCLRVSGRAPDSLTWELGLRDGKPLVVIGPGERLVEDKPCSLDDMHVPDRGRQCQVEVAPGRGPTTEVVETFATA